MRIDPGPRREAADPALPLVNVVFLLLLFVVIAGRLAVPDERAVDLPRAAAEIAIAADGERLVVTSETLAAGAAERFVAERRAMGGAGRALVVTLFADRRADAARVLALAERLAAAGADRVALATVPPAPSPSAAAADPAPARNGPAGRP